MHKDIRHVRSVIERNTPDINDIYRKFCIYREFFII